MGVLTKDESGTIGVGDKKKLDELLKSLDERLQEDKDKRIVDTAIIGRKTEDDSHTDR